MNNIKIGGILKAKGTEGYNYSIGVEVIEILTNTICIKSKSDFIKWYSKEYIQENYIMPEEKWVPTICKIYYYPRATEPVLYGWDIYNLQSENGAHRLKNNLVFKTPEEAIARAKEILEKIK